MVVLYGRKATVSGTALPGGDAESCSIFCSESDFSLATKGLDSHLVVVDDDRATGSLHGICGPHEVHLTALPWTGPGEALAKTILGALAYVRRITTTHEDVRQELLGKLAGCRLLIGVSGSPGFLSDPACLGAIEALAVSARGVLFDGADFHEPNRALLLAHDGRSAGD